MDIPDSMIVHLIDSVHEKTVLHPGDQYNLAKLSQERERIDAVLKTRGYYFFSPDYLYYLADSSVGNRQIDLTMTVKQEVDPKNLQPWYVNKVMVFDNSVRDSLTMSDTLNYKGVTFLTGKLLKPKLIRHFILFGQGKLLTTDDYSITNRNLASLNAFKYTNMKAVVDSGFHDRVDINIELTPNSRNNFRASADMISKSNDFAGPAIELAYLNRNLWGGGEELTIKTSGNVEAWLQKTGQQVIGNRNYELNASAELKFPRFLFIDPAVVSSRFIPSNHIRVDMRYTNQMRFYKMSFLRLLYGYRWSETISRSHELNIIDVTYQHMLDQTFIFDSLVNKNPLLKQSYSDQFMIGTNYTYHYAVPDNDPRRFKTAFTGAVDVSGNLLYGIQSLLGANTASSGVFGYM
jgi:outer membrane protein assembly factor BamA